MSKHAIALACALALSFTLRATGAAAPPNPDKEALELYKQAVQKGNDGKVEEAITLFQQALEKKPKHVDVLYLTNLKLGLAYKMTDRWPEALAAFDAAIVADKKKKKADAHDYQGDLYRDMGLFPMAVDAHKEALERIDPKKVAKVAEVHFSLARDYMEMKLYADAERELRKAVEFDVEKAQYHIMLGNALALNDKYDDAQAEYQKVLDRDAADTDAMYGLGFVERKRGKRDEAKEWFKKACKKGHAKACREAKDKYRALR